MTTHRLDTDALHLAIYARMHAEKLSAQEVAEHTGLSAATLTRIKHGGSPHADGLVTLLIWLERGIEDFTVLNTVGPT